MAAFRISASAFMAAMALMGILALPGPAMGQALPGEQEAMVAEANELLWHRRWGGIGVMVVMAAL